MDTVAASKEGNRMWGVGPGGSFWGRPPGKTLKTGGGPGVKIGLCFTSGLGHFPGKPLKTKKVYLRMGVEGPREVRVKCGLADAIKRNNAVIHMAGKKTMRVCPGLPNAESELPFATPQM